MRITEPVKKRFAIRVSTKAGSTSVSEWLCICGLGETKTQEIKAASGRSDWAHQWLKNNGCIELLSDQKFDGPVVTIHAEPERRIYSYWWNLNREKRQPATPNFYEWLMDLHRRRSNPDIAWHTNLQAFFLGNTAESPLLLPTSMLNRLPELLSTIIGETLPPMLESNKRPLPAAAVSVKESVSPAAWELLQAYCAYDHASGWDGKKFKWEALDQPKELSEVRGCLSMSLYGESAKYAWGALQNVKIFNTYYPGWQCRVYLERGHYAKNALLEAGASVVEMETLPGSGGMFWRFLAADDPQFTHVIIRDADSRVSPRDAACVGEWLASGKSLHVMKDHPAHRRQAVIGGAWGIRTAAMAMTEEIDKWGHNYQYGDDEKFLHWKVWERFRPGNDFIYHDFEGQCGGSRFPAHAPCSGHVCQPIAPTVELPGKWSAFVINAPHYKQRLADFYRNLEVYNGFLSGNIRTWSGLPKGTPVPLDYPHREQFPHYYLATMDHLAVWKKAKEEDLDWLFVFEDDAIFEKDLDDYLLRVLMCIPKDWWAIQLGGQAHSDDKRNWFKDADGKIIYPRALGRVKGCLGMHGVLWSREGYNAAIAYYTERPNAIVDWDFALWQQVSDKFYTPMRWVIGINKKSTQHGKDT